ncbi:MAG: 5'-methylthioadenosine phosphorylase [Xanthomonadales bacterium]|nr:5'-methylthioadenosine phosphorylase [Xanthomonadales bacterium]|tara:strand:+ start:448 stop:1194 length:747 start_codon:yes stop_codon:yes gene_type:complete
MSRVGIIGGTALADLAGVAATAPPTVAETRYGPTSGPLVSGCYAGRDVAFLMRHGTGHRIAPHAINYRANIAALAAAGCDRVIAVAAVGGIAAEATPGRIVIPDQIIDYSWARKHTFYDDPCADGLDHIDFTEPYDSALRRQLSDSAAELGLGALERGVHGITQGPRLETAAEIDRMDRDGCHVVGMTGMPEAALAREAGLAYACCAVVVNKAAGRTGGLAIHAEIEATLAAAMGDIERLLQVVMPAL